MKGLDSRSKLTVSLLAFVQGQISHHQFIVGHILSSSIFE